MNNTIIPIKFIKKGHKNIDNIMKNEMNVPKMTRERWPLLNPLILPPLCHMVTILFYHPAPKMKNSNLQLKNDCV